MIVLANILQPLIDVFEAVLKAIHSVLGSWGWSIVGLTVLVRLVLLPLTLKQFRSMRKLQELAPKIKELQAKYKEDKQRLNEEMMKFYREHQVNPLGSCLPLIAQLPVFISLFYLLQSDLRIDICGQSEQPCGQLANNPNPGAEQFLFIPDLTDKATGGVLIVLIVLYIVSQLASSLLMSVTADRNQRLIMLALPFVFVAFIINFPAGLLVYWITTNVWTIGQQWFVRRRVGPLKVPATAATATASAGGDGDRKPGFLERLTGGMVGAPAAASGGGGSEPADGAGGKRDAEATAPAGAAGKRKGDAGAKSQAAAPKRRSGPPPASPRKKKKRSGRRR